MNGPAASVIVRARDEAAHDHDPLRACLVRYAREHRGFAMVLHELSRIA